MVSMGQVNRGVTASSCNRLYAKWYPCRRPIHPYIASHPMPVFHSFISITSTNNDNLELYRPLSLPGIAGVTADARVEAREQGTAGMAVISYSYNDSGAGGAC